MFGTSPKLDCRFPFSQPSKNIVLNCILLVLGVRTCATNYLKDVVFLIPYIRLQVRGSQLALYPPYIITDSVHSILHAVPM